ncbi:Hypothetical_protein [Hexamita inflata]|uniref:Hypothetical_protein n=1 Tax=Hexamita inflata TaxID=28002 RepID=A0ABP1HRH3_9EUKA
MDSNTMLAPNRTFEALVCLILWSAKQKNGSSSQNGQHTQGNQQFITSSNKLTNLSRQVELVGSDEQKFEGFKISNNDVLNDVQTRPNNNPISFRPTIHHTLCSPFTKFVTYHVNLLTGKLFEIVLVDNVQSYRCGFVVIGANTLNISIYRIQNTKSYQFHSKVEQLRSISKTPLLSIFIEPSYVASYVNEFSLIQIQHLTIDRIV